MREYVRVWGKWQEHTRCQLRLRAVNHTAIVKVQARHLSKALCCWHQQALLLCRCRLFLEGLPLRAYVHSRTCICVCVGVHIYMYIRYEQTRGLVWQLPHTCTHTHVHTHAHTHAHTHRHAHLLQHLSCICVCFMHACVCQCVSCIHVFLIWQSNYTPPYTYTSIHAHEQGAARVSRV